MGQALQKTGRPMVFSLCQYGQAQVEQWGPLVGGNLWRTTGDIGDEWQRMTAIGFAQGALAPYAAPGHWNDPDMLEVGNGHMSNDEYRTHFSLWALLAAPLIAGNDLAHMTAPIEEILLNREVIAVDQDPLGKQGTRLSQDGDSEIWVKPLQGADVAVGLFNRGASATTISIAFAALKLSGTPRVRDLWAHANLDAQADGVAVSVPSHGVVMLRITPAT
jgi:alpha-galactosidase